MPSFSNLAIRAKPRWLPSKDLASEVLRRVTSQDESERMPAESEPLTPEQIDLLRGWIESGARFDGQAPSLPLALVIPPPRYADPPQNLSPADPDHRPRFRPTQHMCWPVAITR